MQCKDKSYHILYAIPFHVYAMIILKWSPSGLNLSLQKLMPLATFACSRPN